MAITIRSKHLEQQVEIERQRRGDTANSRTLEALALERLAQLEDRRYISGESSRGKDRPAA